MKAPHGSQDRTSELPDTRLAIVLSFSFGLVFVSMLLALAVFIPNPTPQQFEIFRITIAVAIAGIAAVIPGFLNLHLSRGAGLGVRAGGALAVFVVVYFYSPAHWVSHPEPPKMKVGIDRVEHGQFIAYENGPDSLPPTTPPYSFLRKEGGLVLAYLIRNPKFLDFRKPSLDRNSVLLPEGEAACNFVVTNFGGSTTVVDEVYLDLMSVDSLPQSVTGAFLPALEPYRDLAILKRNQDIYRLFSGKVFTYQAGQSDLFRIDVRVGDSEEPGIYKFRLAIKHHSDQNAFVTYSEPIFIAKYFGGATNRNAYPKFGESVPTSTTPASMRSLDGIDSVHKPEFYSSGSYLTATYTNHLYLASHSGARHWEISTETAADSLTFISRNIITSIMDDTRSPVQKFGFVVKDRPAPDAVLQTPCWESYSPVVGNSYRSLKPMCADGLEIYEERSTEAYDHLVLSTINVALRGSKSDVGNLSGILVEASYQPGIDAAAFLDIMPLLAIVDTESTLSRISQLLKNDNALVRTKAATLLGEFRFSRANAALRDLYIHTGGAQKAAAVKGLKLSGDGETFDILLDMVNEKLGDTALIREIVSILVQMDPSKSTRLMKNAKTSPALSEALVAALNASETADEN